MGVQSRTLLNPITGDLMRVFRNSWTENCEKLSEKNMWWSSLLLELHEYSLHTAYRTALQIHSENA